MKEAVRRDARNDPVIFAITGSNIFLNTPDTAPDTAYISFSFQKSANAILRKNTVRFACFSKDAMELESLCERIFSVFSGKTFSEGTNLYQTVFLSQKDVEVKLANGFWTSLLFFDFYEVGI
jgi:hypothetical protein